MWAILLLVFEETPHRSNAKKEEMLNQLKLLDQNDTEHIIQKLRLDEEYVSPNYELADSYSIFNVGVDNDKRDKRRNKLENSRSDNMDEISDAKESNDEDASVTAVDVCDQSKGNNLFDPITAEVLNEGATMTACRNAFDLKEKCVVAKRSNCITCDNQRATVCKCRGRTLTKSAKDLSDDIVKDWKLGKVDTEDPNFQDLILPCQCHALLVESLYQKR